MLGLYTISLSHGQHTAQRQQQQHHQCMLTHVACGCRADHALQKVHMSDPDIESKAEPKALASPGRRHSHNASNHELTPLVNGTADIKQHNSSSSSGGARAPNLWREMRQSGLAR
jgi:hypothetical protein